MNSDLFIFTVSIVILTISVFAFLVDVLLKSSKRPHDIMEKKTTKSGIVVGIFMLFLVLVVLAIPGSEIHHELTGRTQLILVLSLVAGIVAHTFHLLKGRSS